MTWEFYLQSFRALAEQQRLCYWFPPAPNGLPIFCFYYNQGSMYVYADPKTIFELVKLAREHAFLSKALDYVDGAYLLLDQVCFTCDLNTKKDHVLWDTCIYDHNEPTRISLRDWLEMWGYKVPAFPEQQ